MISFKLSVLLYGLAFVASSALAERPTNRQADVIPPLIAPESVVESSEFVPFQEVDESFRLPRTSIPTHYEIELQTYIYNGTRDFEGSVDIHLTVLEQTDTIVVHHRSLSIQSAKLFSVPSAEGASLPMKDPSWTYDARVEQLSFTSDVLPSGNYILTVTFKGKLSMNEDGFYVSSYVDDTGVTKYLATTQFESTNARMAFPCYDEPHLKANFTVTIKHHKLHNARSNMKVQSYEEEGDFMVTKFDTTPRMSTYLLAFVVSDFESKGSERHRVYARPNAMDEVDFAVEAGEKILTALENHLGVGYYEHMPEMKQFAIPDFAAGAMENWGLVTYREQYLLFDPALNSYRTKSNIATVVAHEYAHQWFGNLVSPEWWEYLWLNEGFATLYEYYAAHMAYPDMGYWELFNPLVIQAAMVPDGLETTRPMTWNADTPESIGNLFDRVAYPKSGSVLNMMRKVLGEENWTSGLKSYLLARQFDSANSEHLYSGLQSAIEGKKVLPGVTVKDVMDTWTTEKGYPVLSVRRNYENGALIISQERFISDRKVPNTNVWMIPFNFASKSIADFDNLAVFNWLSTKAIRISTAVKADEWIIFNKQQIGFYRVNYDDENWDLITNALISNHSSIHRLNRAQLIDDAYWLARSGRLDIEILVKLLTYLEDETEYAPWAAASNVFSYFNSKLRGTAAYDDFMKLVHHLIGKMYDKHPVDTVSKTATLPEKYLKQIISTWACNVGNEHCLERTKQALTLEAVHAGIKDLQVDPDIASVVYCYGMRNANETEFKYLYHLIYPSKNLAFRTMIINSLGCSQNPEFLKSLLMTAIGTNSEINYKLSERKQVVQSVYSGGRAGVDTLIEFLMDEPILNDFIRMLEVGTLHSTILNIASRTNTQEELTKLNALLDRLANHISAKDAAAARSAAQANIDWHMSSEGILLVSLVQQYVDSIEPEVTEPPTSTTTNPPTAAPSTTSPAPGDTTTATVMTTTEKGGSTTVAVSLALLFSAILITLMN